MHWPRHTTKWPSFAVCNGQGTRQRLSLLPCARPREHTAKGSATSSCHPSMKDWRGSARAHGKAFTVCPTYSTRQSRPLTMVVCRVPFAMCGTRQTLCRGLLGGVSRAVYYCSGAKMTITWVNHRPSIPSNRITSRTWLAYIQHKSHSASIYHRTVTQVLNSTTTNQVGF